MLQAWAHFYDPLFWSFVLEYDCGVAIWGDDGEGKNTGGWEWTAMFEGCTLPALALKALGKAATEVKP